MKLTISAVNCPNSSIKTNLLTILKNNHIGYCIFETLKIDSVRKNVVSKNFYDKKWYGGLNFVTVSANH